MTAQTEIEKLQNQIARLKDQQLACRHQWGESFGNPEKDFKQEFTGEYENHGVHHWPIMRTVECQKPRWTRTCAICGLQQHTYTLGQKTIITGPQFS